MEYPPESATWITNCVPPGTLTAHKAAGAAKPLTVLLKFAPSDPELATEKV